MIRFGVLGPLEVRTEQGDRTPGGPKLRQVLALLLLRANQVVDVDTLAEELWEGRPPRNGTATIRTHVYHLRRMLAGDDATRDIADLLTTKWAGYLLQADPEQLDATVFADRIGHGRALLEQGAVAEAAHVLREAQDMWRGQALANVRVGPVLNRHATYLDEVRIQALELRIEADMQLGRHRELIAELRGLVATHPLNEWLHAQLIDALHRCGRRGEALTTFHELRRLLDEELGLEPSEEVRQLQHTILVSGAARGPEPAAALHPHPRHRPALARGGRRPPGSGQEALQWKNEGHRHADRFPYPRPVAVDDGRGRAGGRGERLRRAVEH